MTPRSYRVIRLLPISISLIDPSGPAETKLRLLTIRSKVWSTIVSVKSETQDQDSKGSKLEACYMDPILGKSFRYKRELLASFSI